MNTIKPFLSQREHEVLILISYGWSTVQIGANLFLSPHTIDTYRKNLLKKFKVKNGAALIRAAFEKEFLSKENANAFAPLVRNMAS